MDQEILNKAKQWLTGNYDEKTKKEIQYLIDNNDPELENAFYQNLEFGTGGLRGVIGVGTNKMNIYTVGMATQGFANYIKKAFPNEKEIKVAVIHDCRIRSRLFAETTANIFAANGFKVYLSKELRPTPELSFAIRHLGCQAGVNITASHNPAKYNGYKAYWNDGCQLVPPHDTNVIDEVNKIASIDDVKWKGNEQNIILWDELIDRPYIDAIKSLSINGDIIKKQKDLKIVYTPIHGTGIKLVPRVLQELGFENVNVVEEQAVVSGEFPSLRKPGVGEIKEEDFVTEKDWLNKIHEVTGSPNPEKESAMKLAIEKGKAMNADIIMATDPDGDRVGIVVKNSEGNYVIMNGNQTATILTQYLLSAWQKAGKLKGKEFVVKTIVTTELITEMCKKYGVEMFDVLTGFKYIGEKIRLLEGKKQYIGGGEESYGYLAGDFVRDKDAVIACSLVAEAAAVAKNEGKSLYDVLVDTYVEYGMYKESLCSIEKEGKAGKEAIKAMMDNFRANPPKELNGSPVAYIKDYGQSITTDCKTGKTEKIDLPKSNVLQFFAEDGSKVTARPSGTEPLIKFYFGVKTKINSKAELKQADEELNKKIEGLKKSLGI
ncbi:MAG: phospho-sugar mutase [Bacteroidales bacterium]|nr:phospho-sugar mutase [Bacteroidales bacterium]MCR4801170.1 phospho-sugar mutase [Bacteroidales bacterium]